MKIIVVVACLLLASCSLTDGYQFGDGTKLLLRSRAVYCKMIPDEVKKAALDHMQGIIKDYPEHSVCDVNGFIVDVLKPL